MSKMLTIRESDYEDLIYNLKMYRRKAYDKQCEIEKLRDINHQLSLSNRELRNTIAALTEFRDRYCYSSEKIARVRNHQRNCEAKISRMRKEIKRLKSVIEDSAKSLRTCKIIENPYRPIFKCCSNCYGYMEGDEDYCPTCKAKVVK